MTVSSEFYDGFRVALQQCRHRDIRNLYFTHLSQILTLFMGHDESPVKHSTLLCRVMATSGPITNESAVTTALMLIRFVLPNLSPANCPDQKWIAYVINGIQRQFMTFELTFVTVHARIFHIYFLTALIEGSYFDQMWIYENFVKFFLCHNGLRYLMDTIKVSIETKNLLGAYLAKQLVAHVLAFMEVVQINDSFLATEILSQAKPRYEKIITQGNSLEVWNLDYIGYDLVSGVDFILLGNEEWIVLVTFLYIGVTHVKTIDFVPVFINIVSLLEMALVKEFEIPDRVKGMMLEIYCKTYWTVPSDIKTAFGEGVTEADKFFQDFHQNYKGKPSDCLCLLAYVCQKKSDDVAQSRQMVSFFLLFSSYEQRTSC